ncbi:MAG: ferredoxin [Candidatus Shapirobacteria bacterium]
MTQKVYVDPDKCIGCNTCPLLDPETFEMDTVTYKAKVKKQPVDVNSDIVKNAIISCPVGAISIIEE